MANIYIYTNSTCSKKVYFTAVPRVYSRKISKIFNVHESVCQMIFFTAPFVKINRRDIDLNHMLEISTRESFYH